MWEILILKVISDGENSNEFQETRFWKEKSVEDVVTLGPTATLVTMKVPLCPENSSSSGQRNFSELECSVAVHYTP